MDDTEDLALSDPEDEDLEDAAPVIEGTVHRSSIFENTKETSSAPLVLSTANPREAGSNLTGVSSGLLDDPARVQLESALKKALSDLEQQKAALLKTEAKLAEVTSKRQEEAEARDRKDGMRNEAFSRMKAAANDAIRQRDEALRQKQEIASALESLKSECDGAMSLISGAEAERVAVRAGISSNGRPAGGAGQKGEGAGLRAAVELFRKRVEMVVDELAKQRKQAQEAREAMREQMDQRNISIAIEVSEIEATITKLKEEVAGKQGRLVEAEKQIDALTRRALDAEVALGMERRRVEDAEAGAKSTALEARKFKAMVEEQRSAVNESRQAAKDAQSQLDEAVKGRVRAEAEARSEREAREKAEKEKESLREGERMVTRDMEGIVDQWREAKATWRVEKEDLECRIRDAENSRDELVRELASIKARSDAEEDELAALRRELAAKSADVSRLEVVLKESQNDSALEAITAQLESLGREASLTRAELEEAEHRRREMEKARDEAHRHVAILEAARGAAAAEASTASIAMEKLQEEEQALRKSLADARREVEDGQRLAAKVQGDVEKEREGRIASEERDSSTITQLRSQVASLEEEVKLWKAAANDEATAGTAVLEEVERCNKQIAGLVAQMAQWRKVAEEASAKVQSKEEMAAAAIAARDAAEKSLQVADRRSAELRARVEALASQLEDVDGREGRRREGRDASWGENAGCLSSLGPWLFGRGAGRSASLGGSGAWLGLSGLHGRGEQHVATAEMEQLMEPFV